MNELQTIEYSNARVLTTQQLAEVYETDIKNIQMNFSNNKIRFIEGKHYHILKGEELKSFKTNLPNDIGLVGNRASQLILWTEKGADRHCKILDTDKAWEQFDNLEETYFKVKNESVAPKTFIEALEQMIVIEKEKQALQLECNIKNQQIGELQPKADYLDRILKSKSLLAINQIAKDYGMSAQVMNKKIHNLGIQYKQGGQWLLYSKYQACGYTHSETFDITRTDGRADVTMNTKWTQKGRLFLYEILKKNGIVPVIERN